MHLIKWERPCVFEIRKTHQAFQAKKKGSGLALSLYVRTARIGAAGGGGGVLTGWILRAQRIFPCNDKTSLIARLRARVEDNIPWQSHIGEHLQDLKYVCVCTCACVCVCGGTMPERFPSTRQEGEGCNPPPLTAFPNTTYGTDETTDQRPVFPHKAPHAAPANTHTQLTHQQTHTQTHTAGMPSN